MHRRFEAKRCCRETLVRSLPASGVGRLLPRSAYKTDLCQQSTQSRSPDRSICRSKSSRGTPASPPERPGGSSTLREKERPETKRRKASRRFLLPIALSSARYGESSWTQCPSTSPCSVDFVRRHRGISRIPRQTLDIREQHAASLCAGRPFDKHCLDWKRDRHR